MATVPASALLPVGKMRGSVVVRADFAAIDNFIRRNEESKAKTASGMTALVRLLAAVVKGYAQQKSLGPVAPGKRSVPALAYRIPVQRITGAYFAGWKIRPDGATAYLVYNDSKEAYLIETGLYQRVRRPILKMSLIAMLKFLHSSRVEQRFLPSLIGYKRDERGRYASVPFAQRLGGTDTLGLIGPRAADDRPAAYLP